MGHKGIDTFDHRPGEIKMMWCRACGSVCEVERNKVGPTGLAEAMGQRGHLHDHFYCANSGAAWHDQAVQMIEAMKDSPSPRIRQMMQKDLDTLLIKHGCGPYATPDMDELVENGQEVFRMEWDSGGAGAGAGIEQILMYRWRYYFISSDLDEEEIQSCQSLEEAVKESGLLEINEAVTAISSEWSAEILIPMLAFTGDVETRIRINGKEYRGLPGGKITV